MPRVIIQRENELDFFYFEEIQKHVKQNWKKIIIEFETTFEVKIEVDKDSLKNGKIFLGIIPDPKIEPGTSIQVRVRSL